MSTLERAIAVAARAHEGQYDKGGAAYILHPLRVMMRVSTPEQRIVAVLHDVIEDTPLTLSDLAREGFALKILAALLALSRREGEPYQDFVVRLGEDPLARTVKLADLADNSDLSRILARAPPTWRGWPVIAKPVPIYRRWPEDQPHALRLTGPTNAFPRPITQATCWLRCCSQACGG